MASPIHQKHVNREAVRILALEHGLKRASELSGVNYETVRKWSQRQHWNSTVQHSKAIVPSVPIGDNVASELQSCERETRLSLARSAKRLSSDAEHVSLRDSQHVHNVAKTAALVHGWEGKSQSQGNVMVNVALLGIQPSEMQVEKVNSTSTDESSHR